MSYSDFDSELTDLSGSEYSDGEDDVPLALKYKPSGAKKSNKARDSQQQNTLRPPRIIQFTAKTLYGAQIPIKKFV